jgi:hypothetical protein
MLQLEAALMAIKQTRDVLGKGYANASDGPVVVTKAGGHRPDDPETGVEPFAQFHEICAILVRQATDVLLQKKHQQCGKIFS